MNHEIHEIHERWNNRTTNGHEWDTNNFFIGKKVVGGWRAWARPRVPYMIPSLHLTARHLPCSKEAHCKVSTHYLLPSPPSSLLWKPTAKCPRTTFSPLLPPPYFGSPLQSDHALLSPPFSLLSTSCIVSTHSPLPSSPYSATSYLRTRGGTAARGAPKRANHALFPTFFSLLSTF